MLKAAAQRALIPVQQKLRESKLFDLGVRLIVVLAVERGHRGLSIFDLLQDRGVRVEPPPLVRKLAKPMAYMWRTCSTISQMLPWSSPAGQVPKLIVSQRPMLKLSRESASAGV